MPNVGIYVVLYLPIAAVVLLGALCIAFDWPRAFLMAAVVVVAGSYLLAWRMERVAEALWREKSVASYDVNAAFTNAIADKWALSAMIAAPLAVAIFIVIRKRAAFIGAR